MSAYLIVDVDIHDADTYQEYRRGVAPLLGRFGGEFIVRGGDFQVMEGDWKPSRLVIIRFPDRAAIRAFLDAPEYAPLRKLRQDASTGHLVAVDGV